MTYPHLDIEKYWPPSPWEVAHNYPGPYSGVEVMGGPAATEDDAENIEAMDVEDVRAWIEAHGGEAKR